MEKSKLKFPAGYDANKFQLLVNAQYMSSFSTVNRKRQTFREWDTYFNYQYKTEQLDVKTLQSVHDTLLSMMTNNERKVRFLPANLTGTDLSSKIEKITQHLHTRMGVDDMYYSVIDNKLKYGVGLRVMIGYDDNEGCPIWRRVDTRCWVPDPFGSQARGFRREGFEDEVTFAELKEVAQDGMDKINDSLGLDDQTNLTKVISYMSSGMNAPNDIMLSDDGRLVGIYHHFNECNGRKYYSIRSSGRTVCHYIQEIVPVYKNEKLNPKKVRFPIAHNWFIPKVMDPFGCSLTEYVIDKHIAKNVVFNLEVIREKNVALGDDVIVDSRAGIDRKMLAVPSLLPKYIMADGSRIGGIANAVSAVPKSSTLQTTTNLLDQIDRLTEVATSIDARQMGISGSRRTTLGEADQLQANNNIRSIFYDNNNLVGEREFWHHTLRALRENEAANKKIITQFMGAQGNVTLEFQRSQLLGDEMPNVQVISQFQAKDKLAEKQAKMLPFLDKMMLDPTVTPGMKMIIQREILMLVNDYDFDSAVGLTGMSFEEADARRKLLLLDNNDVDGARITKMDVDHFIYIYIFKQGLPTAARDAAIAARWDVICKAGLNKTANAQANMGGAPGQDPNAPGGPGGAGLQAQAQGIISNQLMNGFSNGGGSDGIATSRASLM